MKTKQISSIELKNVVKAEVKKVLAASTKDSVACEKEIETLIEATFGEVFEGVSVDANPSDGVSMLLIMHKRHFPKLAKFMRSMAREAGVEDTIELLEHESLGARETSGISGEMMDKFALKCSSIALKYGFSEVNNISLCWGESFEDIMTVSESEKAGDACLFWAASIKNGKIGEKNY